MGEASTVLKVRAQTPRPATFEAVIKNEAGKEKSGVSGGHRQGNKSPEVEWNVLPALGHSLRALQG